MKNILVTGGTAFVSRFVAEYFAAKGNNVYVLNRNTHPQASHVTLIEADRNNLGEKLKDYHFDIVLDVTAYTKQDVESLVNALRDINQYVLISSSAVYLETLSQPFTEEQPCGLNKIWGGYGTNKLEAENFLLDKVPQAYILRPPYLYGPMQNLYREPFVFDCALQERKFYIPKDGQMPLQFFHVEDLCRFIEIILEQKPENHIFNVGNREIVTVAQWVKLCYEAVGKSLETVYVKSRQSQRDYFCFHDYGYVLDVKKQYELMPETIPLAKGLQESYKWYRQHRDDVRRKPYMEYIDDVLAST